MRKVNIYKSGPIQLDTKTFSSRPIFSTDALPFQVGITRYKF